jgi:CubicO group peptidase (beta-lactamase class C family)
MVNHLTLMRTKLLLLLLSLSVAGFAQVQLPDTPTGRQMGAWLQAFDVGDRAAFLAFLEKNYPSRAKNVDQDMNFRKMTGGFDLRKVEDALTPTKVVALVQERNSDQFARMTVEVAAADPYAITKMGILAIPRPAEFPLPKLSQSELVAALKAKLQKDSAAGTFSGDILLASKGKSVFEEAYGLADRGKKTPNTLNTRFRIGSMNKMFTAVAVLQLVQQEKVHLDDPLGKYLPDYPNKDVASKVTVQHLLTHTGGTGDFFGPEFDVHRLELKTFDDYVKLYGNRPLRFEPGSKWEYSNYGFLLLGLIVEKASGQNYYDYVRDHIYKVAGMTSTDSEPEDTHVANTSIGYTAMGVKDGGMRPNADTLPYRGTSAGGGYSTVDDLLRFADALQENKLLNAQYTEMLTTGKPGTPENSYAFGFEDHKVNGVRCFGHGGGAPGMNGMLQICPATGYVVAVLSNLDPPSATRVSDFMLNRLPQ